MATIKSFTDISQSKKLAEILPFKSADAFYDSAEPEKRQKPIVGSPDEYLDMEIWVIPCWSLTALLKYLSEIKPQVYTPILFPSESKWILQFVEYGHSNVCEVSYDNPIDACYEMIIKLHEQTLL